ncbi:hypothetical protein D3C78_1176940 [compost metagenome]
MRRPITSAPCSASSLTVASSASCWMSASTSFMPSDAPILANSLPKPEAAPVMTATRPLNSFMGIPRRSPDVEAVRRKVVYASALALP